MQNMIANASMTVRPTGFRERENILVSRSLASLIVKSRLYEYAFEHAAKDGAQAKVFVPINWQISADDERFDVDRRRSPEQSLAGSLHVCIWTSTGLSCKRQILAIR